MTSPTSLGPRHSGHSRGPAHWPLRLLLMAMALAVLALPFYAASEYYHYQKYMTPQAGLSAEHIDSAQAAAWTKSAKGLPATGAPVVLTYHDISPHSSSPYVVTPKAFDAQLAALEQAGYRTLTADEFATYLRGGVAPPRSVLITFDDGTNGLWVYGDRILARHHMHATSFLITGRVDHDRPYYLTWNEIKRMAGSGRWDFQDHTQDSHRRAPVDAAGHVGSMLANRLWLPEQNRLETVAEYHARVEKDITGSISDITRHGLPKPLLFAFPFSEATDRSNVTDTDLTAQKLLEKHFLATMTDVSSRPLTASRRAGAAHTVQRLEVVKTTTADELLREVAAWLQVPPNADDPLSTPKLWVKSDRTQVTTLDTFTGGGTHPAKARYAAADYRPKNSLDWTGYEATATIGNLGNGTNQGALTVRTDSLEPVTVSVSQGTMSMQVNNKQVRSETIPIREEHTLKVMVSGSITTATVDGDTKLTWTSKLTGADLTGGVGIRVGTNRGGVEWPAIESLRITQMEREGGTARPQDGANQLAVSDATLLDPAATWLSAPGVEAPLRVSHSGIEPRTGRNLSVYGAFQPDTTGAWTDYTVSGTVDRLLTSGVSGAIWVRVGSPLAISVQVSRDRLQVFSGDADEQDLVGTRVLTPASSHKVTVAVSDGSTVITVDETTQMHLLAKGEVGGVAFSAYRDLTRRTWPELIEASVASGV
ncbi:MULTISPECIES: polysaccharide deacetylase family protein [unclassified Streptomyces]|uniref:polysaccharide deacetylase family protein n=1 Tax=unclassified Streptomyces TaxID=2593676 RepID=UPI002E287519|nr:polysaccharide deacetylase family protein [Streptomyces sp. NBC_00223]